MPARYKAGHPHPKVKYDGRLSEDRYAWTKVQAGAFQLHVYPDADDATEGFPTVHIVVPRPGRAPLRFNLTAMTEAELKVLQKFWNMAFEMALPACRERDRIAQEAWDEGDDSHIRMYRDDPVLFVRSKDSNKRSDVERITAD